MQVFDFTENIKRVVKVIFITIVSTLLLIWLNQNSLDRFWQQQYHSPSPWNNLQGNYSWDLGNYIHEGAVAAGNAFLKSLHGPAPQQQTVKNKAIIAIVPMQQLTVEQTITTTTELEHAQTRQPQPNNSTTLSANFRPPHSATLIPSSEPTHKNSVVLSAGDQVFFAGDSLMQAVAPILQSQLTKEYGIKSINLSKQSTGLSYPSFFNWPKTIKKTLQNNPKIKLLVIFLGPNDPWDMPPEKDSRYLRFTTPEWEGLYRKRIKDILNTAKLQGVDVIWLGPPNMRKKKLSDAVGYLRDLYRTEVEDGGGIYISINTIFHYNGQEYSDYLGDGSSKLKLRSSDGIHFTNTGRKTIADAVFNIIKFAFKTSKSDKTQEPQKAQGAPKLQPSTPATNNTKAVNHES